VRARRCGLIVSLLWLVSPASVRADQRRGHERTDFTAYTLRQNEFSVGLGSAAYGLFDQVTIGTYVLPWFAFPWLHAPVATGFIKIRDWFAGPVAVSIRGTFVYLNASALTSELSNRATAHAGLLVVPVELSLSWRMHPMVTQSVQLIWVHAGVGGEKSNDTSVDVGLGGASTASSASLSSLTELRLSRVFALTLRCTLLLSLSDIIVRADYERNGTLVHANLGAVSQSGMVGNVIPGVSFSWSHVNLQLGLGFGTNWLPIVALPTQTVTLVPDADFYVRF
jgi:hypothetical protein